MKFHCNLFISFCLSNVDYVIERQTYKPRLPKTKEVMSKYEPVHYTCEVLFSSKKVRLNMSSNFSSLHHLRDLCMLLLNILFFDVLAGVLCKLQYRLPPDLSDMVNRFHLHRILRGPSMYVK